MINKKTEDRDLWISVIAASVIYLLLPDVFTKQETITLLWGMVTMFFIELQIISEELEKIYEHRRSLRIRKNGGKMGKGSSRTIDIRIRPLKKIIPAVKVEENA